MATSCARKSAFFVVSYANIHFNETGHQFFAKKKAEVEPQQCFHFEQFNYSGAQDLFVSKEDILRETVLEP